MSAPKVKASDGQSFSAKSMLLKDFRHIEVLNGKKIKNKHLKKAFEYEKFVWMRKKEAEMVKDEIEDND